MDDQVLLGEADGQTLTLALAAAPAARRLYSCVTEAELLAAIADFKASNGDPRLAGAAFAAPGPVLGGVLQLTHAPLRLDRAGLEVATGADSVRLVNDFLARALAMPLLADELLERIGGEPARQDAPAAAMGPGPGHGVGMAILNPDGFFGWTASPGEGGHADLPAANDREAAVIAVLRAEHGYVSPDAVLSLAGAGETHRALSILAGQAPGPDRLGFAEIQALATIGDALAAETFALMSDWLGTVAGNLALTAGARGGVYMFSPFVHGWGPLFDRARCRARFEARGQMAGYMTAIPLYLVSTWDCSLLGLSTLFGRGGF